MEETPYITFGSQMGDSTAAEVVQPHLIVLRDLLKQYCNKPYSSQIDEFSPIARIDGDIWYWEFEGCQRLRLYKKDRYITVDIGMPKNKWEKKSAFEIRKYLLNYLEEALNLIVKKLKKEKINVDDEHLFEDFTLVKQEYLK